MTSVSVPDEMYRLQADTFLAGATLVGGYSRTYIYKIGETGFEPATPASQMQCSTGLSYSPFYYKSRRRDLNPRPPDYKSGALPTELRRRFINIDHSFVLTGMLSIKTHLNITHVCPCVILL